MYNQYIKVFLEIAGLEKNIQKFFDINISKKFRNSNHTWNIYIMLAVAIQVT